MVLLGELSGGIMRNEMGTFRVDVQIENPARPGEKRTLNAVLVDTGAELSWVPAPVLESLGVDRNTKWHFRQADGGILERWTGTVVVAVGGRRVGDEVVFGRSEEHTSELQSQSNLVCRLLLEKKKNRHNIRTQYATPRRELQRDPTPRCTASRREPPGYWMRHNRWPPSATIARPHHSSQHPTS